MAFKPELFDIEHWLKLEEDNMLQKICSIFDNDGFLVGQYKTRVYIVPEGKSIPYGSSKGKLQTQAPSLYRTFTYDDEGNQVASLPQIAEWTQACEDAANGGILDPDFGVGIPPGLKIASSTVVESTASIAPSVEACLGQHVVPAGEEWYVRFVHVTSCNRGLWTVKLTDTEGTSETKKRTTWTRFNETFDFSTANGGKLLVEGDSMEVCAFNCGTITSDFDATYIITKKEVNV